MTAFQQVLAQNALKTFQNSDPLLLLHLTLSQHQQGHRGQRREELRGRDLEEEQRSERLQDQAEPQLKGLLYLKDAGDVLPGGVDDVRGQHRADREGLLSGTQTGSERSQDASCCFSFHSPEIQHQTGHYTWLRGLSFRNIVEEQFTVRDHGQDPLPALLHAAGLGDLTKTHTLATDAKAVLLASPRAEVLTLT